MKDVVGRLQGPLMIREDQRIHGRIDGDVTVLPNVRVALHGELYGNLLVCADGHAAIHGRVHGVVRTEGGVCEVIGEVGLLKAMGRRRLA